MARYLCHLCNTIVAYGEKHLCFFHKDEDNVYSLPQLDELDEIKPDDEAKDKLAVSSDDISWRLCPLVQEDCNEESKQMDSLITENNQKVSLLPAVKAKRCSSNHTRRDNSPDAFFLDSSINVRANEVQSQESRIASSRASSENFETVIRAGKSLDFRGAYKRKSSTDVDVYEHSNCEARPSTSFYKSTSEESNMSLVGRKFKSFCNDKLFYMESFDCTKKEAQLNSKNISEDPNFPLNFDNSPGNFDPQIDLFEVLEDLTDRSITSGGTCQAPVGNVKSSANVKEPLDPTIDANTLPGPSGIHTHSLQKAGKRRFACDQCPKEFPFKYMFDNHYRTHTGEKPYVCDKCNKRFAWKGHLNRHYQIHTRGIFICDICGRSFNYEGFFRKHYNTHTPE